jgi:hypothetical protein
MHYRFLGGSAQILALSLLLAAGPAAAEVFRCEWPDGRTVYADVPCQEGTVVAQEISQQVGACVTEACEARRRAQAQAALDRLKEDKIELARMQELRIRQEEAWARIIAARQAAEAAVAAYARPPEEVVVAVYPAWLPHKHFRHHRHHCRPDKGCPPSAGHRAKDDAPPVRRFSLKRRAAPLRVAMDR